MKTILFIVITLLLLPIVTSGQSANTNTNRTFDSGLIDAFSQSAGLQTPGTTELNQEIAFFITFALGFVGIILLVVTMLAGIKWMTAQGDKEKIASAKNTIIGTAIGLFLLLISFAASNFIITSINQVQGNKFDNNSQTNGNNGGIGIEPGQLSQTVCEYNSQCPAEAPFCSGEDWYTVNLGYCNCCDNSVPGYECDNEQNRHKYCQDTYSSGIYNARCEGINNLLNTVCVIKCNPAKPVCPEGQFCNGGFLNGNAWCTTLQ